MATVASPRMRSPSLMSVVMPEPAPETPSSPLRRVLSKTFLRMRRAAQDTSPRNGSSSPVPPLPPLPFPSGPRVSFDRGSLPDRRRCSSTRSRVATVKEESSSRPIISEPRLLTSAALIAATTSSRILFDKSNSSASTLVRSSSIRSLNPSTSTSRPDSPASFSVNARSRLQRKISDESFACCGEPLVQAGRTPRTEAIDIVPPVGLSTVRRSRSVSYSSVLSRSSGNSGSAPPRPPRPELSLALGSVPSQENLSLGANLLGLCPAPQQAGCLRPSSFLSVNSANVIDNGALTPSTFASSAASSSLGHDIDAFPSPASHNSRCSAVTTAADSGHDGSEKSGNPPSLERDDSDDFADDDDFDAMRLSWRSSSADGFVSCPPTPPSTVRLRLEYALPVLQLDEVDCEFTPKARLISLSGGNRSPVVPPLNISAPLEPLVVHRSSSVLELKEQVASRLLVSHGIVASPDQLLLSPRGSLSSLASTSPSLSTRSSFNHAENQSASKPASRSTFGWSATSPTLRSVSRRISFFGGSSSPKRSAGQLGHPTTGRRRSATCTDAFLAPNTGSQPLRHLEDDRLLLFQEGLEQDDVIRVLLVDGAKTTPSRAPRSLPTSPACATFPIFSNSLGPAFSPSTTVRNISSTAPRSPTSPRPGFF